MSQNWGEKLSFPPKQCHQLEIFVDSSYETTKPGRESKPLWDQYTWASLKGLQIGLVWSRHLLLVTWIKKDGRIDSEPFDVRFVGNIGELVCELILLMTEILHQLRLVVYPIIYRVSYIPGGARFQPSTVPAGITKALQSQPRCCTSLSMIA